MIFCVPIGGECRCLGIHNVNAWGCNNHTAASPKDVIQCVFPVKWDSFTLVCFTSEANEDVLLVLTSRWRSFHGLLLPTTPIPVPPLSVSSYPWWEEFLHKLHSTPQREKTCRRLNRGRTESGETKLSGWTFFPCFRIIFLQGLHLFSSSHKSL